MGEELRSLSLLNLRDLAKSKGLKNISKLNKDELIEKILEITSENTEISSSKTESFINHNLIGDSSSRIANTAEDSFAISLLELSYNLHITA